MSMTVEESIGVLEKEKAYMDSHGGDMQSKALSMAISALEEVQKLHAIGTVSEFRELKEKATAKKPIETKRNGLTVWDCPKCGNELYSGQKFCDECGKAIADEFE